MNCARVSCNLCGNFAVFTVVTRLILLLFLLLPPDWVLAGGEQITFYPTYGYKKGNAWIIPMRIWVYESRSFSENLITGVAASLGSLSRPEIDNFRLRIAAFLGDDESGERVIIRFDQDPERKEYRVQNQQSQFLPTDKNGLAEGFVVLPAAQAAELLKRQGARNGWLTFRAVSKKHSGIGRVKLVEPNGLSVISDIDDTIKITEIPAGRKVVIRKYFLPGLCGGVRHGGNVSRL